MPGTLLLLAEAAVFLLCLFVYLRVQQALQSIRHEKIAWENVAGGMDEVSDLLEQLQTISTQLDYDDLETRLSRLESWLQGAEPLDLSLLCSNEEAEPATSLLPPVEEELSAVTPMHAFTAQANSPVDAHTTGKYEAVLQLAEAGWSSLEIAQQTRLGREEVQMILNLWLRGRGN